MGEKKRKKSISINTRNGRRFHGAASQSGVWCRGRSRGVRAAPRGVQELGQPAKVEAAATARGMPSAWAAAEGAGQGVGVQGGVA